MNRILHFPLQLLRRWRWVQNQRPLFRWPMKTSIFTMVFFGVLYPDPVLLWRHINHLQQANDLPDSTDPAFLEISLEFDRFVRGSQIDVLDKPALMHAVEKFVYQRIPYAWDWDSWGVADYMPTLGEIVSKGREDCDGRAVVAAALLRRYGLDASLVADPRHVWVKTPSGELMQPLGPPAVQFGPAGAQIQWGQLLDPGPFAFGISVFPFAREIIILLTLWALLLPTRVPPMRALFGLILLLGGLLLMRMSGADPRDPQYGSILLAAGFLLGALCVLIRSQAEALNIPVGLSFNGAAADASG